MGELLDYFSGMFKKESLYSEDQMAKTLVKNTISGLCDEYLLDVGDVLTFEVLPNDLSYAVMVIDEEPLKSKYIINQVDKSMFQASLREIEL